MIRRSWRRFRLRIDELRLKPILDYKKASTLDAAGDDFRFFGGFESVTDGRILWVRSGALTIPVDLEAAQIYLLPLENTQGAIFDLDSVECERIRWNKLTALHEGTGVFIGGRALSKNGKAIFKSSKDEPLLVILFDGHERAILSRTVRAGRHRNEYWNPITPFSLAFGVFSELFIALSFSARPAFRISSVAAFVAALGPLIPLLPPGLLITTVYQRLWKRARAYRAFRDLVRLPLCHLTNGLTETILENGEKYVRISGTKSVIKENEVQIPVLPSGTNLKGEYDWVYFGIGDENVLDNGVLLPREPKDPMAVFAAIPGDPETLSKYYSRNARLLEIASGLLLISAITINALGAFFIINTLR
ncbi:hypothetical protein MASR2M78_09150 [Treponema sp.]